MYLFVLSMRCKPPDFKSSVLVKPCISPCAGAYTAVSARSSTRLLSWLNSDHHIDVLACFSLSDCCFWLGPVHHISVPLLCTFLHSISVTYEIAVLAWLYLSDGWGLSRMYYFQKMVYKCVGYSFKNKCRLLQSS